MSSQPVPTGTSVLGALGGEAPSMPQDPVELLRWLLAVSAGVASGAVPVPGSGGLTTPIHNSEAFTYFGGTNNIETITYFASSDGSGSPIGVSSFTYVGGGASDDDLILTIQYTPA